MLRSYKAVLMVGTATILSVGGAVGDKASAADMGVQAIVDVTCDVSVVSDLSFGTVQAGQSGASTTSGTVQLRNCDAGSLDITVSNGENPGTTLRQLSDGASGRIAYTLTETQEFNASWALDETKTKAAGVGGGGGLDMTFTGQLDTSDLNAATGGTYTDTLQIIVDLTPPPPPA